VASSFDPGPDNVPDMPELDMGPAPDQEVGFDLWITVTSGHTTPTVQPMTSDGDLEGRVSALEDRVDGIEEDARAARLLAAAVDRDIVTLTKKVDTNRKMINEATLQTRARFDAVDKRLDRFEASVDRRFEQVDAKFEQVDRNFAEVRARFDQLAGGMEHISGMLTILIDREDGRQ
jgi:hypothetical protein